MKVLHIAQSLKGGPASYFDEIIPHQVRTYGAENISLLVPADDLQYLSPQTRAADVHTFPTRQRSIRSLLQFAIRTAQVQRQVQPDILHLHSTYAGAIGRLVSPLGSRSPKIVYCPHGWSFDMSGGAKASLLATIERLLAHRTDTIINISHADQRAAARHQIGPGKNIAVPNGIGDVPPCGLPRHELQSSLGMDPSKLNMLFVGRFDRQKGADIAMQVAALLPADQYRLHAIGDYVVSGAAPEAPPPGRVLLLGWMNRSEVTSYYEAADFLIMPSRWEGFGMAAVEAMRAGTPVLASPVGALPEIVADGIVGRLANDGTATAFVAIVTATSKQRWAEMGVAARQHYLANFTADRLNQGIDSVYLRLVAAEPVARVVA